MLGYNFTERVRRALALAREEATRLHHEYVGTEHMLLGLLREGSGCAIKALGDLGADPQTLERRVNEIVKAGRTSVIPGPDLPYTSRAKKVLELSMNEARELGHGYVGTEHLLLGFLAEGKGIAAQVLENEGVTLDAARAKVVRILRTEGTEASWLAPSIDEGGLEAVKGKPVERIEVILHYRDRRPFRGTFGSSRDAVSFLEMVEGRDSG